MQDEIVIKKIFNATGVRITPIINKGEVNRVYKVEDGKSIYIVRLNDDSELGRFNKEAWCIKIIKSLGIPCPGVINVGSVKGITYMVLSFLNGENGKEITADKKKIWEAIGSYAKKFNSIKTEGFGERMVTDGNFDDSWERYIDYNIESLNKKDPLLSLGVISKKTSANLRNEFIHLKNKNFKFGLVHGDLSFANIIVDGGVVNLIDFGNARADIVPHMEIVDLLQNQISDESDLFRSFLTGYGMTPKDYKDVKPDIKALTILQAVDKLRWAIDKSPEDIKKFSVRIKSLL